MTRLKLLLAQDDYCLVSIASVKEALKAEPKATTKEYWILKGFTDRDEERIGYYFNLECVAWMPLPLGYDR